jgi:hypothetical protein
MSSFKEAFKKARAEQGASGVFTWNGKKYTTDLKEETKPKSGTKPKSRPEGMVSKSPRPKARSNKPKVNSEAPSMGANDTSGGSLKTSTPSKPKSDSANKVSAASTGRKDYKYNQLESRKEQSKLGSKMSKIRKK